MAYTPINWQTGDTITAEKMNKMDNGWSVTTSMQTVFDEALVTEPDESYGSGWFSAVINYDSITVTFDGVEYECNAIDMGDSVAYGGMSQEGPVFTEYPFAINCYVSDGDCYLYTETAETHTLKIEAIQESIETTTEFGKARGYWTQSAISEIFSEEVQTTDIGNGFASGQISYEFTEEPPLSAVVTFDGTEYPCTRDSNYGYGEATSSGPDFTNFPFYIMVGNNTTLYTANAGTYDVSLSTETVESSVSDEFAEAVNSCIDVPTASVLIIGLEDGTIANKTWQEINDAFYDGTACIVKGYGPVLGVWYGAGNRYYMATGSTMGGNNDTFNPAIWKTAGESTDLKPQFYKYNSQMP